MGQNHFSVLAETHVFWAYDSETDGISPAKKLFIIMVIVLDVSDYEITETNIEPIMSQ